MNKEYHKEYLLINDRDLSLRCVKAEDLHFFLQTNPDSLKKKEITYDEYESYKNPYFPDIGCEEVKSYFLMAGEYRIALCIDSHTENGLETGFYSPDCEEAIRYIDFPSAYIKSMSFDDYVFVSILEDLNHYLDEKTDD